MLNSTIQATNTPANLWVGLTVTDSKGKVLTLNKDYTVKYNGERIQPGTYSVTITLKGDYSGTVEKDFTITASKVNVKLNYTSYKYTGKPLGFGYRYGKQR